jgi:hypothetical protein
MSIQIVISYLRDNALKNQFYSQVVAVQFTVAGSVRGVNNFKGLFTPWVSPGHSSSPGLRLRSVQFGRVCARPNRPIGWMKISNWNACFKPESVFRNCVELLTLLPHGVKEMSVL